MNTKGVAASLVTVELSTDEILVLNNAMNEVCNGIHLEGEFGTRMGCSIEEARRLLADIHSLVVTMTAKT